MTNAHTLTQTLGGRWFRSYGVAPCPVCQPEMRRDQNALTLADGRKGLLANCKRLGCEFREILRAAGVTQGAYLPPDPATLAKRKQASRNEALKRANQAKRLWHQAQPIKGTIAETYLRVRGIIGFLPPSLRFHPEAWHGPTAQRLPALIALVQGGDAFAVHRTYLRADGLGKAHVKGGDKLMLGPTRGGAVHLTEGAGTFIVGEGIETTLSAYILHGDTRAMSWAALSTSGMTALRMPPQPGRLVIAPDGDKGGREAALALADRAARNSWEVFILTPPQNGDFNDALCDGVTA